MNFPDYFADADSDFDEADYIIFGVPYDKTSSFRPGASQGPKEIRKASWNFETFNIKTGFDLRNVNFHDHGDIDVKNVKPEDMINKVNELTSYILENNKFPIAIGGEHSITPGVIQAFPKDISIISLDAHIDFRDSYENEKYNHACALRRISDYINIENIAVLGIRSAEKEEFEDANKKNLFYIPSYEILDEGIDKSLIKVKKYLKNNHIYLSLDIDVLDPAFAPGTSTPEPFGINPFDILEVIDFFAKNLIGFDVVEVCPNYDNGETAILAAKIIRYILEKNSSN
jgi:agmatinase